MHSLTLDLQLQGELQFLPLAAVADAARGKVEAAFAAADGAVHQPHARRRRHPRHGGVQQARRQTAIRGFRFQTDRRY